MGRKEWNVWAEKLSLTTWGTQLFSATKTQQISPWFSPQNQPFSKNRGFVTWRMKFTKNRLANLPKFLNAKNSCLGPNNQQKILLKKLRDVGPKIKEKIVEKYFCSLAWKHTEHLVPRTILRWCSEILSKKKPFQSIC